MKTKSDEMAQEQRELDAYKWDESEFIRLASYKKKNDSLRKRVEKLESLVKELLNKRPSSRYSLASEQRDIERWVEQGSISREEADRAINRAMADYERGWNTKGNEL